MMKVGLDVIFDKKKGKKRKFSYSDVHYDIDEWADASKFMPADFDLMLLKSSNHLNTISGWASGKKWDGLKLKPDDKVLYWKKNE